MRVFFMVEDSELTLFPSIVVAAECLEQRFHVEEAFHLLAMTDEDVEIDENVTVGWRNV